MIKIKVWRPEKSNCLFWAIGMQFLTGWQGRLVWVESDLWPGFWPRWNAVGFHVIWVSPDEQLLSYSPSNKNRIGKKQSKREIMFEGYIKEHPKSDIEKDDND